MKKRFLSLVLIITAAAAAAPEKQLTVMRAGVRPVIQGPAANFTGKATIEARTARLRTLTRIFRHSTHQVRLRLAAFLRRGLSAASGMPEVSGWKSVYFNELVDSSSGARPLSRTGQGAGE